MAYEPHTWVADELITHDKLNHMENGIADSVPVTRTVNNKPLSTNVTLSAEDVSAVPTSRTINGQPLTSDIEIASGGVGKSLAGQSVKPTYDTTVTAGDGAEIFNDYRDRTYDGTTITAGNIATGEYSHAEGITTNASGEYSHSEGRGAKASGRASHAEGTGTEASGVESHAEGNHTTASGGFSHSEGYYTTASGTRSHAGGDNTTVSGRSGFAHGEQLISSANYQVVFGQYNVENAASNSYIIGSGKNYVSGLVRSNSFRVTEDGVFASGAYNSSGADYAELFEWADNNPTNEDRRGLFATLDGERIRIAKPGDKNIIGIVSGNPTVLGDVYDDQWQGMYMTDVFGSPIWEDVEVPDQTEERPDPEHPGKTITEVVIPAHTEHRQKLNPNYDNTQKKYKARTERPEWAPVGLIGKLVAVDDGTCEPGGYCTVGYDDGVATSSVEETRYYVMSRIDNTHIRVFIKAH